MAVEWLTYNLKREEEIGYQRKIVSTLGLTFLLQIIPLYVLTLLFHTLEFITLLSTQINPPPKRTLFYSLISIKRKRQKPHPVQRSCPFVDYNPAGGWYSSTWCYSYGVIAAYRCCPVLRSWSSAWWECLHFLWDPWIPCDGYRRNHAPVATLHTGFAPSYRCGVITSLVNSKNYKVTHKAHKAPDVDALKYQQRRQDFGMQ